METSGKKPEIDAIDRKILRALQREGRLSFRDLGSRIHMSSNATAERVRRLQAIGVIRGYHAEVDYAKLGFSLRAYVDIHLQPSVNAQAFETVAAKLPGVVSVAILTGALDLRVRVACHDQAELVQLIALLRSRAGAQETNTAVILREVETGIVME
ncbi:MAG: Lrp/AsnC family transcriptional regulator, leucine-responsive regulatory protein [Acidobacteriaceae bacterium]|jgi:Lrp/AsnC family leucine-responsive transcriptional regulator|nr:Lrp/AsnC family transcriptional regulator, leucine-responsive regulatory protein [Acidobacteriaceae bacterium]